MATEKLRAELEILTAKAEKDLARVDRSLAGVEKRVASIGGKGGKSLKPLGEGLSAATVNANEFEKSMAAANARVIAFGASAGLILQVQRALKETVRATIEVEKSLTDINVVLNTNTKGLQKFGDSLFKIAGQTGQGFKTVAVAATELARQGLGMEQTLKRTSDALILTRLTGMQAEEAVSSLTAAVNSFSKAGITSAQVINKMAKVDQAFAVSSDDLAKAISRVGSSAVDAGVSMDELLAITTAVQQRTARGGAVIGNAFKTIFTRIGRTDVQKKLAGIGVATRDMATGAMLPATKVLENLSVKFQELSKNQQNQIAESVAGVFQVNILRAALGDLSSKYGVYNRALKESASATNEAYLKNQQLNQTLDALVNKTLANLTKAGAAIGGATLKPAIENVLSLVNSAIGAFGEGGRFEEFGKGIGKDIMTGIGNFLAGPGLVVVTAGIGKLAFSFAKFAGDALKGFADIGRQAANRKALEAQITAELQRQPNIIRQIERGELSAANAARDMLASMKASNLEASKLAVTTSRISASMMGMGALRRPGRAQGFIPNFADPNAERASAAMGGYKAGAIKTMNIPGQGSVMYNSAETVKRFPGMQQPAIMPPQRSLAGANYKKSFGAAHGFDPYAAGGFVPNFNIGAALGATRATANMTLDQAIKAGMTRQQLSPAFGKQAVDARLGVVSVGGKPVTKGVDKFKDAFDAQGQIGIVALTGGSNPDAKVSTSIGQLKAFKPYLSGLTPAARKKAQAETIAFKGIQVSSLDVLRKNLITKGKDSFNFSREINQELIDPLARIGAKAVGGVLGNQADTVSQIKGAMGGKRLLPTGTEGELFEKAMQLALHSKTRFMQAIGGTDNAPFDFEEAGSPTKKFKDTLGFTPMLQRADAKRTASSGALRSLIKKSYNQGILIEAGLAKGPLFKEGGALPFMGRMSAGNIRTAAGKLRGTVGAAGGLVPNFSPLKDAITRERAAGVPASAIRVGSSPALKSSGNPGGLGVYNTIHEPAGLHQGISRSRSMGINPKTHGVPNFVSYSDPDKFGGLPTTPSGKIIIESPVEAAKSRRSSDKFDKGSDRLTKAAEKLEKSASGMNMGMGKLMGLTSIAYMAQPALGSMGVGEETQGNMVRGLGIITASQMLNSGTFGPGFQSGYGRVREGMSSDIRTRRLQGPGSGFGSRLASGLGQGLRNMAGLQEGQSIRSLGIRGGGKALMKLGLRAIPYAGTGVGIAEMGGGVLGAFKESPEEKAFKEAQEAAARARENSIPSVAEQVMSKTSVFAGGFKTSTGRVKSQQVRDIRADLFGEGGLVEAGADSKELAKIYQEFTNSFSGTSKEVEAASEKFNKSISEISENIKEKRKALDAEEKAAGLRLSLSEGAYKPTMVKTQRGELIEERKKLETALTISSRNRGGFDFFGKKAAKRKAQQERIDAIDLELAADPSGKSERKVFSKKQIDSLADVMFEDIRGGAQGVRKRVLDQIKMLEAINPDYIKDVGLRKQGASDAIANLDNFRGASRLLGFDPLMRSELRNVDPALMQSALQKVKSRLNISPEEIAVMGIEPEFDQRRQRRQGIKRQGRAAAARFGIAEDRTFFKNLQADFIQDDKTAALRRSYQDALKASTRGLYGESEIKLRETKKSLEEAYERNTFEAQSELGFLDRELAADLQTARGSILQRFVNPEMQDDMLGKVREVSGLRGAAASKRLAGIVAELQDPETKPSDKLFLQEQQKVLQIIVKQNAARRDNTNILDRANVTLEHGITQAELQNQIDQQIIDNKYKYNRVLDMEIKQKELQLQVDKNRFLRTDLLTGRITGQQFASGRARERSMRRDAEGMAGQPMVGFGTIMQETFAYGPRNAAEDFEKGMAEVALTIKDGMKDSIKGLISGAEDFKSALRNVMDKLLDKTLDTGLEVVVGTLFGKLGNFAGRAGGGGFGFGGFLNQGGIVRGGSGVKDDVMTFMQGGEYVIKKSAAQKIGYGTLNAINSYSSGGKARVSLAKDFMYTGDDPTRPTGGGFKVSRGLSTRALFRDDDPQTGRVFGRQQKLASYLEYRRAEQARRDAAVQRVKDQKSARLRKAYIGAAINIGAGAIMQRMQTNAIIDKGVSDATTGAVPIGNPYGVQTSNIAISARGGSPALVQGGEYIMSPRTTAKYGTGFMAELNRGRMPGFNMGGLVGGGGGAGGGITTNNVNLAINVDKSGQTSVQAEQTSGGGKDKEREDKSEIERQKKMGEAIRGVVLKEIERQQRPGGLLRDNASYSGGRRI